MKLLNLLTGVEFDAELTPDHPECRRGQAVVVVGGEVIDPLGWEIIEISDAERAELPWHWTAALLEEITS
jgi:hypothetical protein